MWLGFDIGGTKLALAVGDDSGRLLACKRRPIEASGSPRDDVDAMLRDARALLKEAGVSESDLQGVGVAAPGPVDPRRGVIEAPPNLPGWDEVPLARWIGEALGVPVHLENDANAAALAEWRFGAGQGAKSLIYLTMSTGVGGGLILDGRLYRGSKGQAGEVGHMPVEWNGDLCGCGRRGCLEAYVGGRCWTERLVRETPDSSQVLKLAGARAEIRPEHLLAAARQDDDFALTELARWNHYLARGLVGLCYALTPDVIVLGTIAVAAGESLCLEPVRRAVAEAVWPPLFENTEIRAASLGEEGAYYAALCSALAGRDFPVD